jgi:hypothetical protein
LAVRQTFAAEARFHSHDRLRGIYGRQSGIGAVFPPKVLVFPASYQPTKGTQLSIIHG